MKASTLAPTLKCRYLCWVLYCAAFDLPVMLTVCVCCCGNAPLPYQKLLDDLKSGAQGDKDKKKDEDKKD